MEALPESEILATILPKFNDMRLNGIFCDIELTAGGLAVPAHRAFVAAASGSLMSIFSNESAEEYRLGKYEMVGLTQVQLLDLVDFMYTGTMTHINQENVIEYREIAVNLDIPNLVKFCDGIKKNKALAAIPMNACEVDDSNLAESIVEKVLAKINKHEIGQDEKSSLTNDPKSQIHSISEDFVKANSKTVSIFPQSLEIPVSVNVSEIKIKKEPVKDAIVPSISIVDNLLGGKETPRELDDNLHLFKEVKNFGIKEESGVEENTEDIWIFSDFPLKLTPFQLKVKKRYSCSVCAYSTCGKLRLQEHMSLAHKSNVEGTGTYICMFCACSKSSLERMNGHYYAKHRNSMNYTCTKCKLLFLTPAHLRMHMKSRHDFKSVICPRCKKVFRSFSAWKLHSDKNCTQITAYAVGRVIRKYLFSDTNPNHQPVLDNICSLCLSKFSIGESGFQMCNISKCSETGRYYCAECDRNSTSLEFLQQHFHRKHLSKMSYCIHCNCNFKLVDVYADHMMKSHSEPIDSDSPISSLKMRSCGQCGFTSYRQQHVQRHMTNSHNTKRLYCSYCKVGFTKISELQLHAKEECSKLVVEKCQICAYVGSSRSSLANHMFSKHGFVEPGKTVYQCEHCSYTSLAKTTIMVHVQAIHLNARPHKCTTCGKSYKTATMLRSHLETHTPGNHRCEFCSYETNTSMNLARHMRRKHPKGKTYRCNLCPFQTGLLCELNKHHKVVQHKMVHQKYKQEAAAAGSAISTTKNNMVTVLDPKHKCPACPYVTSNSRHLRMHIRRMHLGTPYSCPHCPYQGATQATLDSHLRNVKHVQRHNKYLREEPDKLPDGVSLEQLMQLGNVQRTLVVSAKNQRKKKPKPPKKTEDIIDWNRFLQVTDDGTMVTMDS